MSKEVFFIGLDLGTTNIKGVLFSNKGHIVGHAKQKNKYLINIDNQSEFDADNLLNSTIETIIQLTTNIDEIKQIKGICIASASGNTVLIGNANKPMIPAISWQDKRVTDEIQKIFSDTILDKIHGIVGWPQIKMMPFAHLSWLKLNHLQLMKNATKICMTSDYINFFLTGKWIIDTSTATTFYLQDQLKKKWHKPFLEAFGISKKQLPKIRDTGKQIGFLTKEASALTGLSRKTQVVAGSFDHPSAAIGVGVIEVGKMLLSCGTSWVVFTPIKNRQKAINLGMLVDPFLKEAKLWGAMSSIGSLGGNIDKLVEKWICEGNKRYQVLNELSKNSNLGANGLMINPQTDTDKDFREFQKPDIAKAIIEGAVFQLKKKISNLIENGIKIDKICVVGGFSDAEPWPQIISDILGLEVEISYGHCAGAVGAAILSGINAGIFKDVKDAHQIIKKKILVKKPNGKLNQKYSKIYNRVLAQSIK